VIRQMLYPDVFLSLGTSGSPPLHSMARLLVVCIGGSCVNYGGWMAEYVGGIKNLYLRVCRMFKVFFFKVHHEVQCKLSAYMS